MGAKIGTGDVSFRLGSATPAAVYLGSEQVWSAVSVPGAPTITSAAFSSGDTTVVVDAPVSDGGSSITGYKFYFDGLEATPDDVQTDVIYIFYADYSGQDAEVSAVNAVGEGAKSDPVTVTAA